MTLASSRSLNTPLPLTCGPALPNRIAKSAMSERVGTANGRVSGDLVRLYTRWAKGGVGLLITGNVMVDARALGESGNVIIEDDRDLPALRAWAKAAKAGAARVWMQINHPGRQSPRTLSRQPVAPSAVAMRGTGPAFATPRALLPSEIIDIVGRFATTTRIAREAGFDGVQIHGAHGYLINQFLSPRTNRREDDWGGDPERRRRFLLEVVRAVRSAAGESISVSLKLNSADFQRGGFDEGESMAVLQALDGENLDLIEISGGTYESAKMFEETTPTRESSRQREAFFLDYVAIARSRVRTPILLTGGLRTRAGMEAALQEGVDVVGLARPMAIDPDLPGALLSGRVDHSHPVQLSSGIPQLDSLIQDGWYQLQLDRMGRGQESDPELGRLGGLLHYFAARRAVPWQP